MRAYPAKKLGDLIRGRKGEVMARTLLWGRSWALILTWERKPDSGPVPPSEDRDG